MTGRLVIVKRFLMRAPVNPVNQLLKLPVSVPGSRRGWRTSPHRRPVPERLCWRDGVARRQPPGSQRYAGCDGDAPCDGVVVSRQWKGYWQREARYNEGLICFWPSPNWQHFRNAVRDCPKIGFKGRQTGITKTLTNTPDSDFGALRGVKRFRGWIRRRYDIQRKARRGELPTQSDALCCCCIKTSSFGQLSAV